MLLIVYTYIIRQKFLAPKLTRLLCLWSIAVVYSNGAQVEGRPPNHTLVFIPYRAALKSAIRVLKHPGLH